MLVNEIMGDTLFVLLLLLYKQISQSYAKVTKKIFFSSEIIKNANKSFFI